MASEPLDRPAEKGSAAPEGHSRVVVRALLEGRLVPLLGAGVNRCGRPEGCDWHDGRHLPDGGELARHLAQLSGYPDLEHADLVRVSQYFELMLGSGALYDEL